MMEQRQIQKRKTDTQPEDSSLPVFEIRVSNHLSDRWSAQFEGLTITRADNGETVLTGMIDQAALHGILAKIQKLGINLISIYRIDIQQVNSTNSSNSK